MDRRKYEQIIKAAIQSEIEAHLFYQQVADRLEGGHLKEMFLIFAQEEEKHRKILEGFVENPDRSVHFASSSDFHVAETVDEPTLSVDMKPAEAIALAMKKEEAAMKHYTQLASACSNDEQKDLFLELASMERGHKAKMEQAFVDIGFPEVW